LQAIALSDPARGAHITRIWAASVLIEIKPMPAPNGGSARGYPTGFGSLAARLQPITIGPNLYFYAAPRSE
jgi:hypothetical protein